MHPLGIQGLSLWATGRSRPQCIQQGGELPGQSSSPLFPLVRVSPMGRYLPQGSRWYPLAFFSGCMECQHIPPALWFSPKPRSGRLARSSRCVGHGPGWVVAWGLGAAEHIWAPSQVGLQKALLQPRGVAEQLKLWETGCSEGT